MNLPQDGILDDPQVSWPQPQMDAVGPNITYDQFTAYTTGANWRNSSGYLQAYEVNNLLNGVNVSAY